MPHRTFLRLLDKTLGASPPSLHRNGNSISTLRIAVRILWIDLVVRVDLQAIVTLKFGDLV